MRYLYMLLAIALLCSLLPTGALATTEVKFFDIYVPPLPPGAVYENCTVRVWVPERDVRIVGVLLAASTWRLVPVKVALCLRGAGAGGAHDGSGDVLAVLDTHADWGGRSTVYVPLGVEVPAGTTVNVYLWAHNMDSVPRDFHAQVVVYCDGVEDWPAWSFLAGVASGVALALAALALVAWLSARSAKKVMGITFF